MNLDKLENELVPSREQGFEVFDHAPQLRSGNYFVGLWPPFTISLTNDHPHPSDSRQFAYKNFGC